MTHDDPALDTWLRLEAGARMLSCRCVLPHTADQWRESEQFRPVRGHSYTPRRYHFTEEQDRLWDARLWVTLKYVGSNARGIVSARHWRPTLPSECAAILGYPIRLAIHVSFTPWGAPICSKPQTPNPK